MKKYILSILLSILTCGAFAQEDITLFFLNDGSFKGFYDEEIDSITYSHLDLDSIWHNDAVVQEIWLGDSVVRIPVEDIDSICHKIPDPIYKQGVIRLDDRYLPYILSVDDMTITFSSDFPENLRPHKDDVLLYEGYNELFPDGFAGKVISLDGNKVICEQADVPDVFEKVVFFGSYAVIDRNQGTENAPAYSLRRVRKRSPRHSSDDGTSWYEDAYDWLIESWRMGDGSIDDIGFGTIKDAIKLEFKNIHTTVGFDYKVTPVVSINYAYDMYRKNMMCFYKRTINYDYTYKFFAKYSRDMKPDDEAKKNLWNSFWKGLEPDWHDMGKVLDNDPNDNDTQSFFLLDKEAPIPDFPLLKIGMKLGVFFQPKLEGELSIGVETNGNFEKTYIFSSKDGGGHDYDGPKSSETNFVLEGSVKGSLWAGGVVGLHADVGFGKGEKLKGVTEEITARVGPYIEGEIKADFADALASRSWYNLVKDSKIKCGWKLGVDFDFKIKFGDAINFKWNQINWTPQHLFGEKNIYFFPKFEAPTYIVVGNSLRCTSIVSRQTFKNKIGFVLLIEDGSEQDRKYLDDNYSCMNPDVKYSTDEYPYMMTLTFDNLDFANHRYTIVPTTRLFGYECLGLQMPDDQRTTVLCPNSHHPHLIDLGLPSGTKWLCQNVYADNPKDAGGFYQWGKSAKVHSYNNASYFAPRILTNNYQGSEYDAATANLGLPYVTPTLSQFNELFGNCNFDIKYSTWGETIFGSAEGVYLKGKNGNNLYLPFSGFMSGTKINEDSEEIGYFLTSDALDAVGNNVKKVFLVKKDGREYADAQGYGYSVRPVSSETTGLFFEPQEIDFGDVLVASQNLGTINRSVRATNTGTAPVTMAVSQMVAPFTVDANSVGTFTLQPKESKDIYVAFEPTDIVEYKSELNIQYDTDNSCIVTKVPLRGKGVCNSLTLSSASLSLTVGSQGTVDITSGSGNYDAVSDATNIVTVTVDGSKLIIKAVGPGPATITVKDNQTGERAKIEVTVNDNLPYYDKCPDDHHPHLIDLGLPSGTKWACCNVGASSPEDYGDYFAWGETEGYNSGKTDFSWSTYKWCNGPGDTDLMNRSMTKYCTQSEYGYNGLTDNKTELDPEDDAAYVNFGRVWRMPSNNQCEELVDSSYTSTKWTTVNGINGLEIISKNNGNSIFLPAAGLYLNTSLNQADSYGWYCLRTLASHNSCEASNLLFSNNLLWVTTGYRFPGQSLRPVAESLPALALSTNTVSLQKGQTSTVDVTSGSGSYDAVSNATNIATVTVDGSKLIIKAVSPGSATITVKDNQTGERAKIEVTVNDGLPHYDKCPDDNHPHLIDMGLPSGTQWACCNVGASSPEDYGDYFAWGETEGYNSGKSDFSWNTYKWCNGSDASMTKYNSESNYGYNGFTDNKTELDPEDDVAYVKWGSVWRIPSTQQFDELISSSYTTTEWITQNGVNGRRITSKANGNSIFLPAAKYRYGTSLGRAASQGYYWSRKLLTESSYSAWYLSFNSSGMSNSYVYPRCYGRSVRPVRNQ